ncbi:hypothetical protein BGZ76_006763 [Entomortierella beljakovae]|nr:hypothetical protein BGZ76_006763 [Entomortierella beljakovae]
MVAGALVSGVKTEDYEWILEQLLEATNEAAPGIIMHLAYVNIRPKLHGALGADWDNSSFHFGNPETPFQFKTSNVAGLKKSKYMEKGRNMSNLILRRSLTDASAGLGHGLGKDSLWGCSPLSEWKISDSKLRHKYMRYKSDMRAHEYNSSFVGEIFSEIEVLHRRYLGESA